MSNAPNCCFRCCNGSGHRGGRDVAGRSPGRPAGELTLVPQPRAPAAGRTALTLLLLPVTGITANQSRQFYESTDIRCQGMAGTGNIRSSSSFPLPAAGGPVKSFLRIRLGVHGLWMK